MADILTSALYPDVRAAIDTGLTVIDIPDAMIGLSIYAPTAERMVKQSDPDWATRTGDHLDALKAASVYYCAALLVLALPNITTESFGQRDYQYTVQGPSSLEYAKTLRARAAEQMKFAKGGSGMPIFFTTAPGERVRRRDPITPLPLGTTIAG